MARLPRLNPPGIPQHIIQRGNNRQVCFVGEEDYSAYLDWLGEYALKFGLELHAYVLMTNHVHILATPGVEESIPKTVQALGRQYVRYFNYRYRRSGTLWEGRYKSSLVQTERYLLECQRYIELNPVRADMVKDPAEYCWSSYRTNALGEKGRSELLTPHEEYLKLDVDAQLRQNSYRSLFEAHLDGRVIKDIREAINRGMALGSERFKDEIETQLKRRVRPARMGRPKKPKLDRLEQKVYSDPT